MRTSSVDNGRRAIAAGEVVLGIDLGTHLGWAVIDSDGLRVDSGAYELKPKKHPGMRWRAARVLFAELLAQRRPGLLAYEDVVRHQAAGRPNFRAAQVYGGLLSHLLLAALEHDPGLLVVALAPSEVKKRATASGAAKKDDMRAAAAWRWDRDFESADEADACWVAWAALQGEGHAPGAGHARGGKKNPLAGRTIGC